MPLVRVSNGGSDLVVTTIINKQAIRTYSVKKDALYFIVSRTTNGSAPSFSGASVQTIESGAYSASAGTGYFKFITIMRALEDGTVTMSYSGSFFDCLVYEVTK